MHGPREISCTHALNVVLLLHVCLMECSENLKMKQKLIECGCVYLLLKELRNMIRFIQTDADSNKVKMNTSTVESLYSRHFGDYKSVEVGVIKRYF